MGEAESLEPNGTEDTMRNTKVTMQRRHFELIAETIRFANVAPAVRAAMAAEFARALKVTNPMFNAERFIEAATEPRADDRKAAE